MFNGVYKKLDLSKQQTTFHGFTGATKRAMLLRGFVHDDSITDLHISCGSTRPFAHVRVRLNPWEVCVLYVTSIPTVKLPMGNHYGYIKKNKRITHDVSLTKS